MERNIQVLPEQASFPYGLPGIHRERVKDKQVTTVNMRVLPVYCQAELIETVLATLDSMSFEDEKQEELIEALRAYITSTEKPLDVQAAKDLGAKIGLYVGMVVWLCAMFFICGESSLMTQLTQAFNLCKELAVYSVFVWPLTIGMAVMLVMSFCIPVAVCALLGSGIGWGIATGINHIHTYRHSVKSEKLLKNLMTEINLLSETESNTVNALATCSKSGFFSVKPEIREAASAPTLGDEGRRRVYSS